MIEALPGEVHRAGPFHISHVRPGISISWQGRIQSQPSSFAHRQFEADAHFFAESLIKRLLRFLLRPLFRFFLRVVPSDDPWERLLVTPPLHEYGSGARLDFARYLTGKSIVTVNSLEEIQEWLRGCQYQNDETLFNERDFWQHPNTFERQRAGDCEDFGIWAWRKLIELDVDADLVAGYCLNDGELAGRHVWIVYRKEGAEYVFEPTRRTAERAVRPLREVRNQYFPEFGVDRHAKRFAYSGYINVQKKLLAGKGTTRS